MPHNTQMRDDDLEALIRLKSLLETESWNEDYYYPTNPYDDEDEEDERLPQDCVPEKWTFFSTNGTSFRGKWVNRNATSRDARGEIILDLVPKDERQRREYGKEYEVRCEDMFDYLLQEVQLWMAPPWNVLPDDVMGWREETGGWHLKIQDTESHDGREGVEFVAYTKDGRGVAIERLLIVAEANSKGIDVLMFLERPRWMRFRESSYMEMLNLEVGLLHFMVLFFGDERWEVMGPPPSPVKA